MFESLERAPPDPILGLTEAYSRDPNPAKINLSVGVYKDSEGRTPVLESVKRAEERILGAETTKSYKPIDGAPEYDAAARALIFGHDHPVVASGRAVTAHTPGGTGALRVAADFLRKLRGDVRVWLTDPTWANHPNVFRAAGLTVDTYPWFDPATNGLALEPALEKLATLDRGDVVLLHACCHNPTGVDPDRRQWRRIAEVIVDRGLLPLVDFAYQGFARSLEEDPAGLRVLAEMSPELLVCSSFSKNFGLYNERVGALTLVAGDADRAQAALSHLKRGIRANYSNPPAHGGAIVTTVLEDDELRSLWEREVTAMRERIHGMRELFCRTLEAKGIPRDFSFIRRQQGMFSFSGLGAEEVRRLRDEHSIYIVGSGRINVAGMTEENIPRLCDAIGAVLER